MTGAHHRAPPIVACVALIAALTGAHAQAAAQPAPIVEVAKTDLASIAPQCRVPGSVVSRDDAKLATSAAVRVEFVAELGTRLKAGDRVAKVEDEAIRLHLEDARSEVARIKAQRQLAERQPDRLDQLFASQSIATNQLDEARAQVTQGAAQWRQAELRVRSAQYDLDQTEVHAFFPGVVSDRFVQRGEFVVTGASIAHLVDTSHLEARVQAPLALAAIVWPSMELSVRIGDHRSKAKVRAIVPIGEEHSSQFELRLALNDATLMVGNALEVSLPERDIANAMAVPHDALVVRADGSYVVRVANDGTSKRVSVHAGASDGELTVVDGLLNAGDLVVVRGAERLASGQKVRSRRVQRLLPAS